MRGLLCEARLMWGLRMWRRLLSTRSAGRALAVVGAGLLALGVPSLAEAQTYPSLSLPSWASLTKDDIDRMNMAAARLYEGHSIGTVERWRNPDTGNAGSVQLAGKFEAKGMSCWRLDYAVRTIDAKDHPTRYVVNWCKSPAGEWKIL
jgi:surface antigen